MGRAKDRRPATSSNIIVRSLGMYRARSYLSSPLAGQLQYVVNTSGPLQKNGETNPGAVERFHRSSCCFFFSFFFG